VCVVGAGQERRQLELLDVAPERVDGAGQLLRQIGVVVLGEQFVDRERVVEPALQAVVSVDVGLEPRQLRGDLLGARLVVPQVRVGRLLLERTQL
jgi:hypothetical protein